MSGPYTSLEAASCFPKAETSQHHLLNIPRAAQRTNSINVGRVNEHKTKPDGDFLKSFPLWKFVKAAVHNDILVTITDFSFELIIKFPACKSYLVNSYCLASSVFLFPHLLISVDGSFPPRE